MTREAADQGLANPVPRWLAQMQAAGTRVEQARLARWSGRVTRVTGIVLEVAGMNVPVGACCRIEAQAGRWVDAQVVGFEDRHLYLMPQADTTGLRPGARVVRTPASGATRVPMPQADVAIDAWLREQARQEALVSEPSLPVGARLLGRVVDATGHALDGLGELRDVPLCGLGATPMNPLARQPIDTALDVGVRAINGLLTIGRGQRVGLFAGSGVGKSVLLGMMARFTAAEVVIVGLIGERGREVKEFIEENLGPPGLAKSVVVAAPADVSPLLRLRGAVYATRIAEYFRDRGRHVLLIMDSLTRYAMAQREIALAVGEPPATKGYPPSVFAGLPRLVERAGNGTGGVGGSITAFYTVLTEGDDPQDPVADAARAILDGHIVLSRTLADAGHYPAINIESSISRVLAAISSREQLDRIHVFRRQFALYQRNRDLITVGAYSAGADAEVDRAIEHYPFLLRYLRQGMDERVDLDGARGMLEILYPDGGAT
ncbi:MAG: FliI/YscN family ATPase [Candidimonas sp.]|nr:MAG: FliI/YscN family ATPase [Candidimonas sp.]